MYDRKFSWITVAVGIQFIYVQIKWRMINAWLKNNDNEKNSYSYNMGITINKTTRKSRNTEREA